MRHSEGKGEAYSASRQDKATGNSDVKEDEDCEGSASQDVTSRRDIWHSLPDCDTSPDSLGTSDPAMATDD